MLATDLHEAAEVPNPKSYKIFKQYPDDTLGSLIVAVRTAQHLLSKPHSPAL